MTFTYQHVVKTCPFCTSTKPRPDRSRVSGLRAEEFGDLIFLDRGSKQIGDKTFGLMFILFGWSYITFDSISCKSTPRSEVSSKLHEWMDTYQMNPKPICGYIWPSTNLITCRHFYRIHNIKRLPTRPYTPWPNRAEMGVRLFKKFLSALVDAASKN